MSNSQTTPWRHEAPAETSDIDHAHEHIMREVRAQEERRSSALIHHASEGVWNDVANAALMTGGLE